MEIDKFPQEGSRYIPNNNDGDANDDEDDVDDDRTQLVIIKK